MTSGFEKLLLEIEPAQSNQANLEYEALRAVGRWKREELARGGETPGLDAE